jgi:hypothetical protein
MLAIFNTMLPDWSVSITSLLQSYSTEHLESRNGRHGGAAMSRLDLAERLQYTVT